MTAAHRLWGAGLGSRNTRAARAAGLAVPSCLCFQTGAGLLNLDTLETPHPSLCQHKGEALGRPGSCGARGRGPRGGPHPACPCPLRAPRRVRVPGCGPAGSAPVAPRPEFETSALTPPKGRTRSMQSSATNPVLLPRKAGPGPVGLPVTGSFVCRHAGDHVSKRRLGRELRGGARPRRSLESQGPSWPPSLRWEGSTSERPQRGGAHGAGGRPQLASGPGEPTHWREPQSHLRKIPAVGGRIQAPRPMPHTPLPRPRRGLAPVCGLAIRTATTGSR